MEPSTDSAGTPGACAADTPTEAERALRDDGWVTTFLVEEDGLSWKNADGEVHEAGPEEFLVHSTHRFEGMSDPADETIVMAAEHVDSGTRGIIHVAFGPDASAAEAAVLRDLPEAEGAP